MPNYAEKLASRIVMDLLFVFWWLLSELCPDFLAQITWTQSWIVFAVANEFNYRITGLRVPAS